ncbi:RDD family protein [Gottfriedia sp. NPDC058432]|uniref:RDD family protein n=1 Tax=Gottfriedia sp. NPDC058432 TaxID=3346497 RepID=UPI00365A58A9
MLEFKYAGFWIRLCAYIIDYCIIILLGFILSPLLLNFFANTNITYNLLIDLIGIIYLMLLPATKLQGTIGKVTVGIKVINKDGSKLSVFDAISRWLAQVVSAFILLIGYIMIAFSNRKTALHDKLANTYVVYK